MVRLWEPSDGEVADGLRGTVRCVRTGVESAFRSEAELVAFFDTHRQLSSDGDKPT